MKFDWRKIIIPLLLAGLLLPVSGLAFDDLTTHPALTDEIVDFYNLFAPGKISQEEKEAIIAGAKSEDMPPRWINHFYDPIYNVGWSGEKTGIWPSVLTRYFSKIIISSDTPVSSLNWLRNQKLQSDYGRYGGNRTWERAVYEYANGNKQEAYYTLGYILHLIEDAAVPDHTRNDTHAHEARFATGDYGSPLEEFAKRFDRSSLNIANELKTSGLKPLALNSVDNYLADLARYSNGYFFSKDTINDPKYSNPKITREDENFGYGRDKNGEEFKLVKIKKVLDLENKSINKNYFLPRNNQDNKILSQYFSRLSREAIISGAGVIGLFHREVNDVLAGRKQAPELFGAKPKSFLSKLVTFDFGNFSVIGESYKAADFLGEVKTNVLDVFSDVDMSNQLAGAAGAIPSTPVNDSSSAADGLPVIQNNSLNNIIPPKSQKPIIPAMPNVRANPNQPFPAATHYSIAGQLYYPGFGGGGAAPSSPSGAQEPEPEPEPPADTTAPSPPVITFPVDFSGALTSADITFSGAAEASSTVSNNLNSATTTVDSLGNWSLAFSFNQGATTIEFFAADAAGNISNSTSAALFIDSVAPSVSLSVAGCENSLWAGGCLLATTTLNISWTSSDGDIDYYEFDGNGSVSTTTATSTSIIVLDNSSNSFSARVKDKAGHWSATSTAAAEIFLTPIVINEVAWAGTSASAADEWVELYNRASHDLNLSSVNLYAQDGAPYINLSGAIPANGFYLIERTDDGTISDISADLAVPFSGIGGSSGLGNGGEVLILSHAPSVGASTTLDRTPDLADCGDAWCAGATGDYKSMERINANSNGELASNWESNDGYIKNGRDADNGNINGTPKSRNSATYHIIKGATLDVDKILTAAGGPYFVPSALSIADGVTLSAGAGTVVKFAPGAGLIVEGILNIAGGEGNETVFTSFYDDNFGGDLNSDGASTAPAAGDWSGIVFNNHITASTISYAKFYHASAALTYGDSPIDLTSSLFENNGLGVKADDNLPSYGIDSVNNLIFTNTATSSPFHFFCGFLDSMPWGEGDCELFLL